MLESLKPRGGKRWPRGQKFAMSPNGAAAEAAYREVVVTARAQGRATLESAERAWAEPLHLQPGDGVVLGELRSGKKSIADVARALEDCGTTQPEVKSAIDRLSEAGLVEPTPVSAAAAA
jgi:hypothetical protein